MNYGDYSPPPPSPSRDHQRDALQKGLGRAMQWAMTRRLDDEPLMEACLRDLRFDVQVEGSRGAWLWRVIRATDASDRFRVPILHALYELPDERSAHQLCELTRCYAEAGDETFRMRLYEIVEQKPIADSRWLGEEEIIQLDGAKGFLFAARVRGEGLTARAWEWDDEALVQGAIERFGEERVKDLLSETKDSALRVYRDGWQCQTKAHADQDSRISHRERMKAIRVGEILSAAESSGPHFGLLRGWGMYADDLDLAQVLQHLSAAREAKTIANLLQVFSNRAAPQFVDRFIELGQHGDPEVRRRALFALANIEHPLVRAFALPELEHGVSDGSVVGLFIRNYQRGDEHRILEALEFPADSCERHWLLMDLIKVLEANPGADCSRLAVVAYASTPCENCRFLAARLLLGQHVAPEWLVEECRFDSSEETRELVERTKGSEAG
jgi:hypothetical protein